MALNILTPIALRVARHRPRRSALILGCVLLAAGCSWLPGIGDPASARLPAPPLAPTAPAVAAFRSAAMTAQTGAGPARPIAVTGPLADQQPREFDSHWDARWLAEEANGACRLQLDLPHYGRVSFLGGEAGAAAPAMAFELRASRDLMAPRPIFWRRRAPSWHPQFPALGTWASAVPVPGFGARLVAPVADRLALDLYAGYEIDLAAAAGRDAAPKIFLRVSALGYRAAYDDFRRCQEADLPASLLALRRTRVLFATGANDLRSADRQRLEAVARYVSAEPMVQQVFIDGHTDAVGSEGDNAALSRRRAQVVFDALVSAGVDPTLLKVRYHGERYPVIRTADNKPQSANRRTTVRVELGDGQIARH